MSKLKQTNTSNYSGIQHNGRQLSFNNNPGTLTHRIPGAGNTSDIKKKLDEIDFNLTKVNTSISELTDESNKKDELIATVIKRTEALESHNTELPTKLLKYEEFEDRLNDLKTKIVKCEQLEHYNNELKLKMANYEQWESRITTLENTLKPIYDTYIFIKNIIPCNWCDFSTLTGESVIYVDSSEVSF